MYCAVSLVLHLVNGMECRAIKPYGITNSNGSCVGAGNISTKKFRSLSVETVLFYAVVVLNFFAMQHEFSCVKRARVRLLSPNQIREVVMDSDSDEDKSYTSQESEDEEEPRPPL
jgi:hypothetical protein